MSLAVSMPDINTIVNTAALVIIAGVGGLWAVGSVIARRSHREGLDEGAISRVTEAIDRLTDEIKGMRVDMTQHVRDDDRRFRSTDRTLSEHLERLVRVEERVGIESSAPHPHLRVASDESGPTER